MNTDNFDYDAFFAGLESADTHSNHTTSPATSTENDSDSGIGNTPPMPIELDNTVIDLGSLDILPIDMESPFSDDLNDELNLFSNFLDQKNPFISDNNSTFENLFSNFDLSVQQNQEISQEIPSPQLPILLPKPSDIPSITNCIKLQSYTNTASTAPKCIKLDTINSNQNIRIITTSQPITVTNVPVIRKPLTTNNSIVQQTNSSSVKRRRADSPVNYQQLSETPVLTLDQLKLQYGNMNEEALKKHLRMIKNRESASLSRKRRKELMENLDVKVKELTDENDQLKKQNSKLLTRVHTLELENKFLKEYKVNPSQPRKPLILMGIVLLVIFNVFTLKSFTPVSNNPSNSVALYNNNDERAIIPGRTILSDDRSNSDSSYLASSEQDYGPHGNYNSNPSSMPTYPYIQCVAYINKTHSRRINQDLHSLVQEHREKQEDSKPIIIPDPKSLTIPSTDSSIEPLHHISRKVARKTKIQSETKGQLQPYKTFEANYDGFIHTLDRKNDTLYFVSFKRDHLILPATVQNQTQRPKMSLIIPASMANLNKSIRIPPNHAPMIQIDCEVEDTKLIYVNRAHVPLSYQNDLFRYYSSEPQASI